MCLSVAAALIRCIVALHDLVKNKIQYKEKDEFMEKDEDSKEKAGTGAADKESDKNAKAEEKSAEEKKAA